MKKPKDFSKRLGDTIYYYCFYSTGLDDQSGRCSAAADRAAKAVLRSIRRIEKKK